jgi:hypothetical protein
LTLVGVNTASYNVNGFSYDSTQWVATWTVSGYLGRDKLLIDLSGSAGGVTDTAGNLLDGQWSGTYPSGNGTAGGDLLFRFNVLPGDTKRDGFVDISDAFGIRPRLYSVPGDAKYSLWHDVKGDAFIDISDAMQIRPRLYTELPSTDPTPLMQSTALRSESVATAAAASGSAMAAAVAASPSPAPQTGSSLIVPAASSEWPQASRLKIASTASPSSSRAYRLDVASAARAHDAVFRPSDPADADDPLFRPELNGSDPWEQLLPGRRIGKPSFLRR